MDNSQNIFFSLEETNTDDNKTKLINLDNLLEDEMNYKLIDNDELSYFIELRHFSEAGDLQTYYNMKYTLKDLMKICNYYGISKNIKASKCKKQDIIETIVYYENCIENSEIVYKRHKMWAYITELLNNPRMKQYIIW